MIDTSDYGAQRIFYVEFKGAGTVRVAVSCGSCFRRDLTLQCGPGNLVFEFPAMDRTQALLVVYDSENDVFVIPPSQET